MLRSFLYILFLFPVFLPMGKLKVTVNNIQPGKGSVILEIYDNENDFFKKHFTSQTEKAEKESMDFHFEIPEGTYAIAVYQDLNDNKLLDRGWGFLRIPKEPAGLSTNYHPRFSVPDFDDCKFKVGEETAISIDLR